MITDRNLKRARVSWRSDFHPSPEEWVHLSLAWDQRYGILFYVNGKMVGEEYRPEVYDCALGIFGPHSRAISNWNVSSAFNFVRGDDDESIAILSPVALDDRIKLIICNISDHAVEADMLGAEMTPGRWSYSFGIDESDSDRIENLLCDGELYWERGLPLHLSIPAGRTCVFDAHLVEKSSDLPQDRYDLGISRDDLCLFEHGLNVRIHSLGAVSSPEGIKVVLKRPDGSVALDCELPSIEAPTDLYPRTWDVIFNTWQIEDLTGYTVEIDPESKGHETTRNNNSVRIDAALLSRLKEALYEAHHRKIF